MKTLLLIGIAYVAFAGETLSPKAHMSIHNTNHKPSIQLQKKRKMHQLHKVDEKALEKIVLTHTGEAIERYKLQHIKSSLIYNVQTMHYNLHINALDGLLVKKEKK